MDFLTVVASEPIIGAMTDWLTCREGEEKTGYAARYLQRLCRQGKLKCALKGRVYLIEPQSLDAWVKRMKSLGTAKHNWRREFED